MRRKLVVANWKMHGSKEQLANLLNAVQAGVGKTVENVDIAVCPSFLHIAMAAEILAAGKLTLGAQDANANESGAYTGEVAAAMLPELGVKYVIVGHSERRTLFGETDLEVAEKFSAVQKHRMTPILCVGESLQQRDERQTEQVVLQQLQAVLDRVGADSLTRAVIAYEPVWAIGTGKTATPQQAQEVHRLLRNDVAKLAGNKADAMRIIYGGSVKPDNAAALFAQADIDGALVGGASLNAVEFLAICKSADS